MSATSKEHKCKSTRKVNCGVITLSDSRKNMDEDLSGDLICENIEKHGYNLILRSLIADEPIQLMNEIKRFMKNDVNVILTTGGTGLDERDITVETLEDIFDKKIEGFGEIFRMKSYEEIGSSAILSRATAGIYEKALIFAMPGSPNAVKTAMNIIIEELPHLVHHANK